MSLGMCDSEANIVQCKPWFGVTVYAQSSHVGGMYLPYLFCLIVVFVYIAAFYSVYLVDS